MGRTLPARSAFGSGASTEAVGEVVGSGVGGSTGATDAVGDAGSGGALSAVAGSSIGCSMTRVTSLESSAPQSVSISSVDGGVDGSEPGASLVDRGGTEDDCP